MDVQFIVNVYDVTRYLTNYMSKVDKSMSELLKQANKEIKEKSYDSQLDVLKTMGNAFIRGTEVSAQ